MARIELIWDNNADRSLGLPAYESRGAAGADLRANFGGAKEITLMPGERQLIPTGLRMAIPAGFEVQINKYNQPKNEQHQP